MIGRSRLSRGEFLKSCRPRELDGDDLGFANVTVRGGFADNQLQRLARPLATKTHLIGDREPCVI